MSKAAVAGLQLTAIELVGDTSLKTYAATGNLAFLGIGCASYAGLVYTLQDALKTEPLWKTNTFWDSFSGIATLGAGMAMGETPNQTQILGVILISLGLYLI